MSVSTKRLKSSSSTTEKRVRRDSHHDWNANKNKSIVSKTDMYEDYHNSCCDKFCRLFSTLPMISPLGTFRCSWDVLVMLMLLYTSLEVPFTIGFGIQLTLTGEYQLFGIIAFVIDLCLCIDIILNFRTAFFDKYDDLRLITNPVRIAKRYFRGWFWIDLITSFPIEFMIPSSDHGREGNFTTYLKMLRIFRLFRIFKILRLLKMVKLFDGFVSNIIAREMIYVIRLFKVLCFALLSAHICACLWYYVGCSSHLRYDVSWISEKDISAYLCGIDEREDDSLFVRYSFSWYWSVVTLFTTGYGDVVATNPSEQWIASFVILIGTCLFGYFVGTITSLITEGDKVASSILNKLEDAQHFCQQKKLPAHMARAVLTHTRYHCHHNYVLGDEKDVLSNLPSYLAMDVSLYISRKYLENLDFFGNKFLDPYIRGLIALKIQSISCNKGYKLFVKGDVADKIYIQRIGKSNHFIYDQRNPNKKPVKKRLSRGDVCGEYALILKQRDSTLVCETWCEFYVLDVSDIKEVLEQHYQTGWNKRWKSIRQFIKKEYLKAIKKRKRRKALLQDSPLLPSFRSEGDLDTALSGNEMDDEGDGDEGHVDWEHDMKPKELKQLNELQDLQRMATEILNANANDLNNNNISFGLNALSKNAYRISKLTNKNSKNQNFIKSKIISPNAISFPSSQTLLRALTRNNSFLRDIEVTKDYRRDASSDSSEDDDVKLEMKEETQKTLDVADFIEKQVQMMELHRDLNKNEEEKTVNNNDDDDGNEDNNADNDNVDDDDDNGGNDDDNGGDDDDNGISQMIQNLYSDLGDDDDEEEKEDDEDSDSLSFDDGILPSSGNKSKKKKNGNRKKKKRKTQKAHS